MLFSQVVFTDYPLIAKELATSQAGWTVTEDRAAAGVVYLVNPQRDFVSLDPGVVMNQFPYEVRTVSHCWALTVPGMSWPHPKWDRQ